jgi:hypothetical protein
MREIRTYGLNEGLLARALRTAGWGLLHHGRAVGRRSVVEMAPPVIVIRWSTDERRAQPASPARVFALSANSATRIPLCSMARSSPSGFTIKRL